ncbi:MAG: AAA family ATPase [Actinomycetes bacterium]
MTILYETSPSAAEAFTFALGGDVHTVDSPPGLTRALHERPNDTLVVIGPDVDMELALDFAAQHRLDRPSLGVVLMRRRVDVSVLGQAIRAGVREVVSPDDLSALGEACRRSLEVSSRAHRFDPDHAGEAEGKIVTVFAAKGGCGKTTVATNLATSLAAGGARRVCLVDLDLAFGDVAIALQLFPTKTIVDAIAMASHMDETGLRSLITPHSPGLDTVLAPLEPGDAERIPASVVTELLGHLRLMYDYVVIDSPPAFTEHVLASFDMSDQFVLLTTLDIPALKNLRLTLDMLDMLGYPRSTWQIVLNRSDSKVGLSIADVEKTLKAPIAAHVPSSRAVSASINKGVPLVLDEPNHSVSQAIRQLATGRIIAAESARKRAAEKSEKKAPAGAPKERRSFTLLRRGA